MVKHSRRRATRPVVTRKSSTQKKFFKKTPHNDADVAKVWNQRKSRNHNMRTLGLACDVNKLSRATTEPKLAIFEVPQPEDLEKVGTNARRNPLAEEKQRYIAKLIAKHGEDFDAMARDIKRNVQQFTATRLRNMTAKFLRLDDKHRAVPIPARLRG
ncbi:hypothetical protein CTAYLR_006675 [Chrysophaeum taylorii]|uniref:Nucleolar protein 16 n=1 Tax=Chrysophaeum taylorii TaxID=2483200 RepID=A0AAD7XP57_9STRA|nr:hypothetical protein CTAYLR_006675 [Chrysophaeum taylorii]